MRYLWGAILTAIFFAGCGVSVFQMGTDITYAKQQIKNGVDIHARYEDKETVLFWAAKEGSIELVDFYLSHGADINAKNRWDSRPLHWAVYANQLQMVKHLISKAAQLTAKDAAGRTALQLAQSEGFKGMVEYLKPLMKRDYPAFIKAKKANTLQGYKIFMQAYAQSPFMPLVETLIKQRTEKLFDNPQELARIKAKLMALIDTRQIKKFMDYTAKDHKALIYAKNDEKLSLLFVGPKDLTVGQVLAYYEENYGELVLAAKIKGLKKPYKDFSFDEIKTLKKMGLADILLAAMLEVSH